MTEQQIIEYALNEMSVAEAMIKLGNEKYYNARKKLEGFYSPASPERVPHKASMKRKAAIKAQVVAGFEKSFLKRQTTSK